MSFPISSHRIITHAFSPSIDYKPLDFDVLEKKLEAFTEYNLHEPMVLTYTPNYYTKEITIKGILDDVVVLPPDFGPVHNGFNIVILYLREDSIFKINGSREEKFSIQGSERLIVGDDCFSKVILIDGSPINFCQAKNSSGLFKAIASETAYKNSIKIKV